MWYDGIKKGEETGLKDIDGKDIFTGDIVEFYFDADNGYSLTPDSSHTRMRDIVEKDDEGTIWFVCSIGKGLAARHFRYCRVIGTDPSLIDT